MDNGKLMMGKRQWKIDNKKQEIDNEKSTMGKGELKKWTMGSSQSKMEDGKWTMGNGQGKTDNRKGETDNEN